jgi:uncharacterized protein (DUF1330 family)
MVAYVIAEIDVHDRAAYQAYVDAAPESIARYGGTYRARGGAAEALEGAAPKRMVLLEFPNADAARRWYHSAEYQAALKLREGCATGRLVVVDAL